ncbi:hypothetical protein SLE2022_180490 [Rubroshorea leprosula]
MSVTLSESKHLKLLPLLKSPKPSSSLLLLRHLCAEPDPQPPKHDDEAIEATVTQALELLKQTPQHDWATFQPLHTLLFSSDPSPRVLAGITRRLPSHSAALNFVDYLRSNSPLQDAQLLSSAFLAVLELAKREMDSPEMLSELYRVSKEWKVPLNVKAAVLLIRCFGRAGMIHESAVVFNELDPSLKSTHVCNVFISVLLKAGCIDDALKVLDGMLQPESEVPLNDATADTFFQALLKEEHKGMWLSAEEIVELVLKFGEHYVFPSSIVITKLIARLCRGQKFNQALDFLRELMKFHAPIEATCFNLILTELGRNGDVDRMNSLLREMRDADIQPDITTFGILINTLCKLRRVDAALDVFKRMREGTDGIFVQADVVTYTTLIDGLCKVGRQEEGLAMMEQMRSLKGCAPNTVTYNCLIDGFCKGGEIDKARELFAQMLKSGCSANAIVYNTMISGLSQAGRMDDASNVWSKLKEAGFHPNTVSYNVLIGGFCKRNMLDKACEIVEEMEEAGMKPDTVTYNILITYFSRAGDFSAAQSLMKKMVKEGLVPTVETYGALVHARCLTGQIEEALKIFKNISKSKVLPNTIIYNILIEALCKNNRVEDASSLMDDMKVKGVKPNTSTYNSMFRGLKEKNSLEEAFKLMDRMINDACNPDYITMKILTEWLSAVGEMNKLKIFLRGHSLSPAPG